VFFSSTCMPAVVCFMSASTALQMVFKLQVSDDSISECCSEHTASPVAFHSVCVIVCALFFVFTVI